MALLEVEDLKVTYPIRDGKVHAVNHVTFEIGEGEIYGLVGESGSGKSTIAESVLDLLPENATVEGRIDFDGRQLHGTSDAEKRRVSWDEVAYIPQSAMDALDPVMTTGAQIAQTIKIHQDLSAKEVRNRTKEVFEFVGLEPERIDDYPHQFSGGMRQRVTIAMALALDPKLIIADEPTTGLDVIVQDKIIKEIIDVQEQIGSSLLIITHDIGIVAETCQRIAVLYGGKIMEKGVTKAVLDQPANPYTMGLKNSFPEIDVDKYQEKVSIPGSPPVFSSHPSKCVFEARCPFSEEKCLESHPDLRNADNGSQQSACHFTNEAAKFREMSRDTSTWGAEEAPSFTGGANTANEILSLENVKKYFPLKRSWWDVLRGAERKRVKAVNDVSLSVDESEILGLAGESGSGKSTLGRTIVRLEELTGGQVLFKGENIDDFSEKQLSKFRANCQIIFQDAFGSMNPRLTVNQIVKEPLDIHGHTIAGYNSVDEAVNSALENVGLTPVSNYLDKHPHELSGGEKQRVVVARSVVLKPDFLICDEPASSLDVSLKIGLLNLLRRLSKQENIGMIYISHDLASLAFVSDKIAIMYLGKVVEMGKTRDIITSPRHPYTNALVNAIPNPDPTRVRERVMLPDSVPDPIDIPTGCAFADRCPKANETCTEEEPPLTDENGQQVACYFPVEDDEDFSNL